MVAAIPAGESGSVYVHGYTRKDGTYVEPYWRAAPGTGGSSSSGPGDVQEYWTGRRSGTESQSQEYWTSRPSRMTGSTSKPTRSDWWNLPEGTKWQSTTLSASSREADGPGAVRARCARSKLPGNNNGMLDLRVGAAVKQPRTS